MRKRRVPRKDPGNGRVFVPGRRAQSLLGVSHLLGQSGRTAEEVGAERQVVEFDGVQDRRQILRAQFGGILVAQSAPGLNGTAQELDRVRKIRELKQADQRTVHRVVEVVEIGRKGREYVQRGFQAIPRFWLQD